jgi:hypothetical protein
MMKFAGLIAAALGAWHLYDHEWIPAAAWGLAVVALTLAEVWWRSARDAWRTDR